MFWISFLVTALLVVGIVLAFGLDKRAVAEFFSETKRVSDESARKKKEKKHIPLKKQIEIMTGKQKKNFLVRSFNEATEILIENHEERRIRGVYVLSVLCGVMGLVISAVIKNVFLIPSFVLGAALIPVWMVKLTASGKKKRLNNELEVALSGVTTSYIRSDNFLIAVEENLIYMNGIVKHSFTRFLNESRMINSNISLGIQKLSRSIDNDTFHEWCDAMYQCQSDRTLKATLFPIVNRFSETKSIQAELDTMMMIPFKDTITIVVVVILSIPMMKMLNPDWYAVLVGTVGGQLILGLVALAIIYSINLSISLTRPIKYGEG